MTLPNFSMFPVEQLSEVKPESPKSAFRVLGRAFVGVVCWLNALFIGFCMLLWCSESMTYHGSRCGNDLSFLLPGFEMLGVFTGFNLFVWAVTSRSFRDSPAIVKWPALFSLIVWLGVGIGIKVGQALPISDESVLQRNHP